MLNSVLLASLVVWVANHMMLIYFKISIVLHSFVFDALLFCAKSVSLSHPLVFLLHP